MKKIFLIICIFFTLLFLFSCSAQKNQTKNYDFEIQYPWIMYGANPQLTNKIKAKISPPLKLLWKKGLKNNIDFQPVVYSGILYTLSDDNKVCALDINNGNLFWEYTNDKKITTSFLILESFLYFGDEKGTLYCLDTFEGKKVWTKETPAGFFGSSPAQDVFNLFISDLSGWIYNFSIESGNIKWKAKIKSSIKTTATQDEEHLYITAFDSCVYSINKKKVRIDWFKKVSGNLDISASSDDMKVYVPIKNKGLVALDKKDGKIVWEKELNLEYILGPMALSENTVYASTNKAIYAIDKKDGKIKWKNDAPYTSSPIITDRILYVGDKDGNLHAFNKEQGKLYWKKQILDNEKIKGIIIGEEKLFVLGENEMQVLGDASTGSATVLRRAH